MALLCKKFENAARWFFNELKARSVVRECDVRKFDFLLTVLKTNKIVMNSLCFEQPRNSITYSFLLKGKHVMIEELVQLLVGVVDAQLLKGVSFKVFKSKDVQDSNKLGHIFPYKI